MPKPIMTKTEVSGSQARECKRVMKGQGEGERKGNGVMENKRENQQGFSMIGMDEHGKLCGCTIHHLVVYISRLQCHCYTFTVNCSVFVLFF